ncbi:MAG: stress response kinase A, partial [Burkholderiales bacterium]
MTAHPYSGLTPDAVLDALESAGVRGDGRLLALNSYENRVYQVYLEEAPPVVAKFY